MLFYIIFFIFYAFCFYFLSFISISSSFLASYVLSITFLLNQLFAFLFFFFPSQITSFPFDDLSFLHASSTVLAWLPLLSVAFFINFMRRQVFVPVPVLFFLFANHVFFPFCTFEACSVLVEGATIEFWDASLSLSAVLSSVCVCFTSLYIILYFSLSWSTPFIWCGVRNRVFMVLPFPAVSTCLYTLTNNLLTFFFTSSSRFHLVQAAGILVWSAASFILLFSFLSWLLPPFL